MQCEERRVSGRRGTQAASRLGRDRGKTVRGTHTHIGAHISETQDAYADDRDVSVRRQAGNRDRLLSEDSERHTNSSERR